MVFSISYNPPKIWNKSLSLKFSTQSEKLRDWDLVHYFENGTKSKVPSEITYPTFIPAYTLKKNRQIVWNQIKIDFRNCFDLLEMCDKTQSVYCLSVPFRLIRSICFLSVKCENMYFMRKIKFMPCHWEFLFYQTCLGRSVCNRKI